MAERLVAPRYGHLDSGFESIVEEVDIQGLG